MVTVVADPAPIRAWPSAASRPVPNSCVERNPRGRKPSFGLRPDRAPVLSESAHPVHGESPPF